MKNSIPKGVEKAIDQEIKFSINEKKLRRV
jgi:hypothetical protein